MEAVQAVAPSSQSSLGPFSKELVRQLRALDSYGQYDSWSDDKILDPMILTKERKAEIPLVGDPDEVTVSRVRAFYNAIAVRIETQTRLLSVPLIHLSHEGFGRALITTGKLVVLDRTLRDVHRFGFPSLAKMEAQGDRLVEQALKAIEDHPEVAGA